MSSQLSMNELVRQDRARRNMSRQEYCKVFGYREKSSAVTEWETEGHTVPGRVVYEIMYEMSKRERYE